MGEIIILSFIFFGGYSLINFIIAIAEAIANSPYMSAGALISGAAFVFECWRLRDSDEI